MGQILQTLIYYLIFGYMSKEDREIAKEQIKQNWNSETISTIVQELTNQLNRDIVTKNQVIRALQNRNEDLAQSIILSSPIGTRIRVIKQRIAQMRKDIEANNKAIEDESNKNADIIVQTQQALSKWNQQNPTSFDAAVKVKGSKVRPEDRNAFEPKPAPTPTPSPVIERKN